MAINKRKDAAALFELIDKSTLKIPKNAGQLKIPSWWSSRTNPPTAAVVPELEEEAGNGEAVVTKVIENTPKTPKMIPMARTEAAPSAVPQVPTVDGPAEGAGPEAPVMQQRLFDPFAHPEESPSIRPPVKPAVVPEVRGMAAEAVAAAPVAPPIAPAIAPMPRVVEEKKEAMKPSAAPPPTQPQRLPLGVFAPRTMDPATLSRRNWMGQQKIKLAHVPVWAIGVLASGAVVVVFLIAYLLMPHHGATPATRAGSGGSYPAVIPATDMRPHLVPTVDNTGGVAPVGTAAAAGLEHGKVYRPGEVARTAGMLYLVIATSSREDVTQRNAQFLADHGVSVSIDVKRLEPKPGDTKEKFLYVIISVQGFAKNDESAEAFRKQVVLGIGREHPEYKKNRKDVWADAYYATVTPRK